MTQSYQVREDLHFAGQGASGLIYHSQVIKYFIESAQKVEYQKQLHLGEDWAEEQIKSCIDNGYITPLSDSDARQNTTENYQTDQSTES